MADISQIKLPSGDTFDIIDEKSGYITAQYIENKTDYSIPVSRVGEIVVGETAIGTDSTNFPTSKAVVDYVDERVVQEIDAIDVGITKIKANGTNLPINDGVVNIPVVGPNQSVGLMTDEYMSQIYNQIDTIGNEIPTSTSQLTNDSGFITASDIPTVPTKTSDLTNDSGFITSDSDEKLKTTLISGSTIGYLIVGGGDTTKTQYYTNNISVYGSSSACLELGNTRSQGKLVFHNENIYGVFVQNGTLTRDRTIVLPDADGTFALTSDIPTVPTNISSFTNDSGYLTASDIASVMTYKGTKANYAALPSTGNTTGDVWHLTDTGAEWAWDGSAWQELGIAIDLSNYLTTSDISVWAKAASKPTYTAAEVGAVAKSGDTMSGNLDIRSNSLKFFNNADVTSTATIEIYGSTFTDNYNEKTGHLFVSQRIAMSKTPVIDSHLTNKKYVDDSISALSIPTKTSDLTNDSGFLTSYTETDPVFSASAAAGITSTDISNWNAKVSDDKTWNGVELDKDWNTSPSLTYVPHFTSTSATSAKLTKASCTPGGWAIAKYDNGYLNSTTPSTSDNSTKVATTAYVNTVIPKVYSSTNTGGYLTMATLPIYDGTVV